MINRDALKQADTAQQATLAEQRAVQEQCLAAQQRITVIQNELQTAKQQAARALSEALAAAESEKHAVLLTQQQRYEAALSAAKAAQTAAEAHALQGQR